jgi:hypothetical protein
MANKLKSLRVDEVSLVDAGANPDAHVALFKRKDSKPNALDKLLSVIGKGKTPVAKDALTFDEQQEQERIRELRYEAWGFASALGDSLSSIIEDKELDADAKLELMYQSLQEFAEASQGVFPKWAHGYSKEHHHDHAEPFVIAKENPATEPQPTNKNEEETDTMKIDKSKMNPEEQATLADFEKRFGVAEEPAPEITPPVPAPATVEKSVELHPEVKKALDELGAAKTELAEVTKSLEIERLTATAQKYEVIGKKAGELAPKLYELKKAGGTVYGDYVALLDEQVTLIEKSGVFKEIGSNRSGNAETGDKLNLAVAEIQKGNDGISRQEAIVKAFEANPELAAEYENEYGGKR